MSAGYAVITVQTAWLKLYYPIDFMMATLNSVITKQDKLKYYIADARSLGIKILGPDVNKSEELFTIEGNSIRTGLKALRNVGKMALPIISERNKNGLFKNLEEFIDRLLSDINKKVLESLIYSGALDCFEGTRKSKITNVPEILDFIKNVKKGQFPEIPFTLPVIDKIYIHLKSINFEPTDEYDKKYLLDKEYEYAGMFISGHPLDDYDDLLKISGCLNISLIIPEENDDEFEEINTKEIHSDYDGQKVSIAGIIRDLKQLTTKRGEIMYMCSLEDKTATIKCVIFPKVAKACLSYIEKNNLVIFEGEVSCNDKGCQLIVGNISDVSAMNMQHINKLYINCPNGIPNDLRNFLTDKNNEGMTEVFIQCDKKLLKCSQNLNLDWATYSLLKEKYQIKLG